MPETIARITRTCLPLLLCVLPWASLRSQTNAVPDQIVTNRFYSEAGKWVMASNTHCLIWSSFPKAGETVTWSGPVVDGKASGKGVVQWFTNGTPTTSYVGEMKAGLSDGHGTSSGFGYDTVGEFKNGRLVSKQVTMHYPGGGWYKGENQDGVKEGEGEEVMKGGIRYIGHFKQDRFDGAGVMIWPNGDKITGEWKNSQLLGIGVYTQTNGESIKVKMTEKGIARAE